MVDVIVKRTPKEKFQQEIEDSALAGWDLESQNENEATLTKKGDSGSFFAHIIVFIFLGWWTVFIANLLYACICTYTHRKILHIKIDKISNEPVASIKTQNSRRCPNCSNENLNSAKFCDKCGYSLEVSNPQESHEKTKENIEARPEKITETKEEMLTPQKPQEIIGSKNASN